MFLRLSGIWEQQWQATGHAKRWESDAHVQSTGYSTVRGSPSIHIEHPDQHNSLVAFNLGAYCVQVNDCSWGPAEHGNGSAKITMPCDHFMH
eukprot:292160-Pelagomonas_calceolata.AAC.7